MYTTILLSVLFIVCTANKVLAQLATIAGKVISEGNPVALASVILTETSQGAVTDSSGYFLIDNVTPGSYHIRASCVGHDDADKHIVLKSGERAVLHIVLNSNKAMLNEVVVTGVLRATRIRENPLAVVSVTSKAIQQTTASNIIDVLVKNVPGLNAVQTGPNVSKPFIRGLGYNRVLTLYNGIRQEGQQWGDEHGIEVDAYHIERAEVIKGPASLMYGSDALAGVVSLFPCIPNNDDGKIHGSFTSEYQSNNNLIGNGLRLHYSTQHFLFGLSGSYRLAKNYRNAIDGRVYNTGFSEKNISALVGYKTDKGYTHFNFTIYDNLQGIPDGSRDSLTRQFTKQIDEGKNDEIKDRPIVSNDELNAYRLSPLHQHIQHYRVYTKSAYTIGKGNIDILLALQQNIRREYNHPTMPEQAGMYVRLNTLNYDLRYNAPKFLNIETAIGVNGMLQRNVSKDATDFPIPDYNLADGGMYVYAKWKQEDWSVSGGVRYDIRRVRWNDFYVKNNPVTGFGQHVDGTDTAGATLQFAAYTKSLTGISASLGFAWQLTKQVSLKANIGRGYRAPNITELASNGLDPGAHIIYLGNRNFKPEFSLQIDVGMSATFNDVSAEVSLFNNNIQNYIYLTMLADANGNPVADAQGNKTYQYQQAAAQLYGMEAWLAVHPQKLEGLRINSSLAIVYGYNRKQDYKKQGNNGEYLPLIPPLKWVSNISQRIEINSKIIPSFTPKLEMELNAAQYRFLGLNNTEAFTPRYHFFNIGLAAEIKNSKTATMQLLLQVNNVFDKVYQSHLNRLKYFEYYSQSPTGYSGIYNMGRNVCMKLIVLF
jgi:iron complex outermembrane receptor protein